MIASIGSSIRLARYDSYPSLPATSNVGDRVRLKNPLSPTGDTEMYWTGTLWAAVPKQIIAEIKPSPANASVWDVTPGAGAVGTMTEVYQSTPLPDWFFWVGASFIQRSRWLVKDLSSTANFIATAALSSSFIPSDVNSSTSGLSAQADTAGKGNCMDSYFRIKSAGVFHGTQGWSPSGSNMYPDYQIGTYSPGATRFRASLNAGSGTTRSVGWLFQLESA